MLVEFTVQNYSSFNAPQTFSMLASSSTKENYNTRNTFNVDKFGIDNLVKSAAIFGANASGKSNFIHSIHVLRMIILSSLLTAESDNLKMVMPFMIKKELFDKPSKFEIAFIHKKNLYRYGISIVKDKISEEFLYLTKTSRETLLFRRIGQKVTINQRSFSEAKHFIKKKGEEFYVDKTRENVPFVSVLSQFNGEKSRNVTDWFLNLNVISGIDEDGYKSFTIDLLDNNVDFRVWVLKILASCQIQNINIVEYDATDKFKQFNKNENLGDVLEKINVVRTIQKSKKKYVEIVKTLESGDSYAFPIDLESEGTKKLLYLLGPIFDVIKNGEILFVDEFDSKFHTLLSKFILELYHQENNSNSQLVITCHDTNLLTKDLFRRDQIWFIDKNSMHESELYSLLEYREHYTRKSGSYNKEYLEGKYGAIPLFNSIAELETALDG